MDQGDLAQAISLYEESISVDRELGDAPHRAIVLVNLGAAMIELRDIARAKQVLREGLALNRDLGDRRASPDCLDELAIVAFREGRMLHAVRLFGAVDSHRESIGYPRLGSNQSRVANTLASIKTSMSGDEFGTTWTEGRSMSFDDAITYALGDDEHELTTQAAPPAGLSRREIEVLRLIAEGKSDKEIAATLSISPYTVMRHVQNILTKLDLPSRTAAATWAMRNGVVILDDPSIRK
jgi:DNA-binding CsgD family transcriptional regulator